jgi:hypothetical protein
MKEWLNSLVLIVLCYVSPAQDDQWLIRYESSGFAATSRYDETVDYCRRLDDASHMVSYQVVGRSAQGRDIPMLVVDRDGLFHPASARSAGKAVLLIQAGIHPGEIDGKDAGLMFIRDLVIHERNGGVPANLTILFIPIFNVDGHERFGPYNRINQHGPEETGWRTTAQNLNLNRDFVKADSPEMRSWLDLFRLWLPDMFVDIHVTDGADYQYVITYSFETLGNMDEGLTGWVTGDLEPFMLRDMKNKGHLLGHYVMFRRWHDPRSGLRSSASGPRFSQGYAAAQNRIGLLVENHSLKDYKTRVTATYDLIVSLCDYLDRQADRLIELNLEADSSTASPAFREKPFPVSFTQSPDSILVDFLGVEYEVDSSSLTGGNWFRYHPDKPATYQVPYFNKQLPDREVSIPYAYIIPPEWTEVIARLSLHGIAYTCLEGPKTIPVSTYRFAGPKWNQSPFEGRFPVKTEIIPVVETREFPAGSVLVPTDQRTARLIAHMLEPFSEDSFLQWGFFNAIFEMKEYFETYIMEEKAREMIKSDPLLLRAFLDKKASDPDFAKNQWAMLEWFFLRSPYADSRRNAYPIGKITDAGLMEELTGKK